MSHRKSRVARKPLFRPQLVHLEAREVPAANLTIQDAPAGIYAQFNFVDPNPNAGGRFGTQRQCGCNYAGAVYLFNGTSGALISTLTGSTGPLT